jgi:hypothetical protein
LRERWFGATGHTVPEIALEGEIDIEGALVVDDVTDVSILLAAHAAGTPVVVQAETAEEVQAALARPEVSCVVVPPSAADLLDLDLTELTYD